jgi:hypothetical protein
MIYTVSILTQLCAAWYYTGVRLSGSDKGVTAMSMTHAQFNIIFDAIVNTSCKVNRYSDNRTINALVKRNWIVANDGNSFGFDYTVSLDGYRAALVFAASNTSGAMEIGIERLVYGFANQPRPY